VSCRFTTGVFSRGLRNRQPTFGPGKRTMPAQRRKSKTVRGARDIGPGGAVRAPYFTRRKCDLGDHPGRLRAGPGRQYQRHRQRPRRHHPRQQRRQSADRRRQRYAGRQFGPGGGSATIVNGAVAARQQRAGLPQRDRRRPALAAAIRRRSPDRRHGDDEGGDGERLVRRPGAAASGDRRGGLKLDSQVAQLVQAMATYAANNPGFDPTAVFQGAHDPALQSAIAAAWHH
jgi:hypothetical protein